MSNKKEGKEIGLAIIGCGTIGRIRGVLAREYPGVGWIGCCDIKEDLGRKLAEDINADFFTTDYNELINRPEVTATIIATDENLHYGPTMAAIEKGHGLFIEKPLATEATESLEIFNAIDAAGIDAVVGYTQRFRRRFLAIKERIVTGQIGETTAVVTRAFMNRMVPLATLRRTERRAALTPMVVSGTHSLDACLWLVGDKEPVEVVARSGDRVLGELGTKDATLGIFTMADGMLWSMSMSWALPEIWPGSVYGLQIGVVGTTGAIDIEDTHRDAIVVSEHPLGAGYQPRGFEAGAPRHVDFIGSYPPGDMSGGRLWGPMRDETMTWFDHLAKGHATHHATAADGHRNLLLTMAMDLAARRGTPVRLPVTPEELLGDDAR